MNFFFFYLSKTQEVKCIWYPKGIADTMKFNEPCNENTQKNYKIVGFSNCWWKVRLYNYRIVILIITFENGKKLWKLNSRDINCIMYLQDQIEICKWKRTHIVKTLKKFFLFWLQKSIWNFAIIFSWFPVKPFLSSSFDIFLSRVTNWECFKEWLSVKNIQFFSKLQ